MVGTPRHCARCVPTFRESAGGVGRLGKAASRSTGSRHCPESSTDRRPRCRCHRCACLLKRPDPPGHDRGMVRTVNTRTGAPVRLGFLPPSVVSLLRRRGGIVSTRELRELDIDPTMLELYRDYGSLQAVRHGWHCSPCLPDVIRLAWRLGGPLACVSALDLHHAKQAGIAISTASVPQPLHIVVPTNTPRVASPALIARRWGIAMPDKPVIHWSTADFRSGDRQAVSREVALRQADRCAALLA